MKISELIKALEKIQSEQGDLDVMISNTDDTDFLVKIDLKEEDISVGNDLDDSGEGEEDTTVVLLDLNY